jgi:dTDP-4-dehydrorhamnose 3,5-epimerase
MKFHETELPGVFKICIEPRPDERGFFARTWCQREFEAHGLDTGLVQCNISFNVRKGTLRGMHYQAEPYSENKLIRCTSGSIFDAVVDLRRRSPTFKKWIGLVLTAKNRDMVYVPTGCAHGFLTLEDHSEVFYQMSEFYNADSARGVRWNDSAFQIAWPEKMEVICDRDRMYADFD